MSSICIFTVADQDESWTALIISPKNLRRLSWELCVTHMAMVLLSETRFLRGQTPCWLYSHLKHSQQAQLSETEVEIKPNEIYWIYSRLALGFSLCMHKCVAFLQTCLVSHLKPDSDARQMRPGSRAQWLLTTLGPPCPVVWCCWTYGEIVGSASSCLYVLGLQA